MINWPNWVRSWPCIDKNCEGGTICLSAYDHGDGELEYHLEQCQFCDEREMLANEIERLQAENERMMELVRAGKALTNAQKPPFEGVESTPE